MDDKKIIFQVPSEISKIITMSNRCLRLNVDTEENLNDEQISRLFNLYEKRGWFSFNVSRIREEDLIDLPEIKVEKGEKTPAKRLRDRMFVYYKQNKNAKGDGFEDFYKTSLEKIGDNYLSKIERED